MKVPEFLKVNRNPEPSRCHHTSEDGTNCKAPAQSGKDYCFFHDPAQKEKRAEANRNGGAMRGRREEATPLLPPNLPLLSLKTPAAVAGLYEETINQVRQGQIDLRVANTIGYLATMLLTALESTARVERQKEEAEAKAAHPDQPRASSGKKQPQPDLECHVTDLATGTVRIIKGGVTTVIPPQPRIPPDPPLPGDPYHHNEHASIESIVNSQNERQRAFIDSIIAQERRNSNLNGTSGSKPLSAPAQPEPRPQHDAGPPRLETTATRTTTMTTPTPVKTTLVETPKAEPPKPAAAAALSIPAPSTPAAASPDKQAKYQHKPEPPGCPTYWRY